MVEYWVTLKVLGDNRDRLQTTSGKVLPFLAVLNLRNYHHIKTIILKLNFTFLSRY